MFYYSIVLLARIQCFGNFRDLSAKNGSNGAPSTSDAMESMFTFTLVDREAKTIRVAAFNAEAFKYQSLLKVSFSIFFYYNIHVLIFYISCF